MKERYLATVGNVHEDGITLVFDGDSAETQKRYLANTSVLFKSGDRVKILPVDGTYIVEYVVGKPRQS